MRQADELLSKLGEDAHETLSAAIEEAAMLFENHRFTDVPPSSVDGSTAAHADVNAGDVVGLRRALERIALGGREPGTTASAVWALGKLDGDGALIDFCTTILERYLEKDGAILHQALIALENFGVDLGRTGASIIDVAGNRSKARAYLASLGRGPAPRGAPPPLGRG